MIGFLQRTKEVAMSTSVDRMTKSEIKKLVDGILRATRNRELSWGSCEVSSETWSVPGDRSHRVSFVATELQAYFGGFNLILKESSQSLMTPLTTRSSKQYMLQITSGNRNKDIVQGSGFLFWRSQLKRVFDDAQERQKQVSAHAADWGWDNDHLS